MGKRLAFADFETKAIVEGRPDYPPRPVGLALEIEGEKPRYLAWGHPSGNNTTEQDAKRVAAKVWKDPGLELVFQNASFDLDVGREHLGLEVPPWERVHDTLFLLFLDDPHARSLSLKPSAERLLKMKPEEQDKVRDWLMANQAQLRADGLLPSNERVTPKNFGAYISLAPPAIVGPYALGDVTRTRRLLKKLLPSVTKRGMLQAYERERRLLPILLDNQRDGVHVDVDRLREDVNRYGVVLKKCDALVAKRLQAKDLDVDSDEQLADALEKRFPRVELEKTAKGQRKVSYKSLKKVLPDKQLIALLTYRSKLATSLRTFMGPWLTMAERTGGTIHTSWAQVRGTDKGGARTGRIQSSPNFQNMVKALEDDVEAALMTPLKVYNLPSLPLVRSYITAGPGCLLVNRDYSQQELRILGHYEDGVLLKAYHDDPRLKGARDKDKWFDIHRYAQKLINGTLGTNFARRPIKNTGFGLLYGMGLDLLAESTGTDRATAKMLKSAYLSIFPGLKELDDGLKDRAAEGLPIRTWGGREYYCEPASYSEKFKRMMTYDYKLLNYLIQGSAADCTKEALIAYDGIKKEGRLLLSVHDEIMLEAPRKAAKAELQVLREAMASVKFDVPMLSDGRVGPRWDLLKDVPEREAA